MDKGKIVQNEEENSKNTALPEEVKELKESVAAIEEARKLDSVAMKALETALDEFEHAMESIINMIDQASESSINESQVYD